MKRKFELLRLHTSCSVPDLAAAFGRPAKTLQFWAHGSRHRDPDRLPDWALPIFTTLVAELLPASRQADDVRDLVFGPAARLEEIVRSAASASMAALLATEARQGTATLVRRPGGIGLVEIHDGKPGASLPRLALGEGFRIEFPQLRSGRYGHPRT